MNEALRAGAHQRKDGLVSSTSHSTVHFFSSSLIIFFNTGITQLVHTIYRSTPAEYSKPLVTEQNECGLGKESGLHDFKRRRHKNLDQAGMYWAGGCCA